MSFIKNFTEKLLEQEFRPIPHFYNNVNIGENTEYIGFIKQTGNTAYAVIIINADVKYDYRGFYKDALKYFSALPKAVITSVFVTRSITEELTNFTDHTIEDYNDNIIDIMWIADISNNKLIVNGEQPDKIIGIEKLVNASFTDNRYSVSQDISTLYQKVNEKHKTEIKSSNCILTLALIIINGIIEIIVLMTGYSTADNPIILNGAIYRNAVFSGQIYRLFTYMFLHGSIVHYMGNALSLYILGTRVEKYYGKLKMLAIYIISGLGAGLLSIAVNTNIAIGASGAIFGLMSAIGVYTKLKNRSMEGFDNYLVIVFAIIGIFSGFLYAEVDNAGHIGGFITGLIISFFMLRRDKNV
ncbi:MAG: rhomboid family intramembrane serine protease [Clostridia bacterium]|nr:rhomboid family intramembrane serine protease [Clostridia bacterium]